MSAIYYPQPANAGGFLYGPGSEERKLLHAALSDLESVITDVPSVKLNPWNQHGPPLAEYHELDPEAINTMAIPGALEARKSWARMSFRDRAAIYKRAAYLVQSPKYRWKLLAATMIGQVKTCGQAEGDCITEVVDTLNFHVYFCAQLYQQQPPKQFDSSSSRLDYRPLEGFLMAISPFNFTALGAHIAFTPAILGNIMEEAGLPPGVIQFAPGADPRVVVEPVLSRHFAGLHYTGSSAVLRALCSQIGANTGIYRNLPRIVGESGGKNFHLIHNSCKDDIDWLASAAVRSAFEFQGQKCSALSRLYVPQSMWEQGDFKHPLVREASKMTHGDSVTQLHHALGPMVSQAAFERFGTSVQRAQKDGHSLIYGGKSNGSKGFFVQPAIFEVQHGHDGGQSELMTTELFGPLFAVQTYEDGLPSSFEGICKLIDETSDYGLAGSVFARDREAVRVANDILRDSVGMFCINDKSTGAIIGAHPFGGARASGTNDKANSVNVLLRFSSIRCVKDSYVKESPKFSVRRLIATVGNESSKRRVEDALCQHVSHLTVLTQDENVRAVQEAEIVLLAVKPFKRADLFSAPGFKEAIRSKLVLSIMAGITTKELARLTFGKDAVSDNERSLQAVRAMPNMAAKIRESVTLYTPSAGTTGENLEIASWVFSQIGQAHRIPESSFDICGVLVGCAGSLLLLAIDGLLDAAVAEGVRRPEVQDIVVNSAIGMMKLVPAGDHPGVLREKIASPGGCSIRALLELEKLGVRSAFSSSILAAAEKSKTMSSSR
ncbi:Aldehyde/histidinol dehydrogenase [Aspergillus aurantiobrunneus]